MCLENLPILILAGGKGTRLAHVVSNVPKPMAPIQGRPFLEYLVNFFKQQGARKFFLLTGHLSNVIESHFPEYIVSKEESPLGTGGSVLNALSLFPEQQFLVVNGDTFFGCSIEQFVKKFERQNAMALTISRNASRYGFVEVGPDEDILSFKEKDPTITGEVLINAGLYLLNKELFKDLIPNKFISLESDVFPTIPLKGRVLEGHFIDIGIEEDFKRAQSLIPKWSQELR